MDELEGQPLARAGLKRREVRLAFNLQCGLPFLLWHCHLDLGHTIVTRKKQAPWALENSLVVFARGDPWETLCTSDLDPGTP